MTDKTEQKPADQQPSALTPDAIQRRTIELRIVELNDEMKTGAEMSRQISEEIRRLNEKDTEITNQMLRISGAIQALEELLV